MTDQTQITPLSQPRIDLTPISARLAHWWTRITRRAPSLPGTGHIRRDIGLSQHAGYDKRALESRVDRMTFLY